MDSFILEDVNSLLELKKGDSNRLNHIKELCEANELISLSDRKYVERLSFQYLRKYDNTEPKNQDKPKFIPIDETPRMQQAKTDIKRSVGQKIHLEEVKVSQNRSTKSLTKNLSFLSNKNIIFASVAIVLAIILIAIVAVEYDGIQLISNTPATSNPKPSLPITLELDDSSYEASDIISISGKIASPVSKTVRVSIENEQGKIIWAENLDLKNNGEFSTLALAGGEGWEKSGKYNLVAEHEEIIENISFNFVSTK